MKQLFKEISIALLGGCGIFLITIALCHLPVEVIKFILLASVWTFIVVKI